MINSQRLEKYIHNREWQKSKNGLLCFYESLTPKQRQEIKEIFKNNIIQKYNLVK